MMIGQGTLFDPEDMPGLVERREIEIVATPEGEIFIEPTETLVIDTEITPEQKEIMPVPAVKEIPITPESPILPVPQQPPVIAVETANLTDILLVGGLVVALYFLLVKK